MTDDMQEIWALYADDGANALDAMETALAALGAGPDRVGPDGVGPDAAARQAEAIGAIYRAVHTFKGNARVLGLSVVESRAHRAEDLIGLVRDHGVPMDAEIHDILLRAMDTLRDMLEDTARSHADVDAAASAALMTLMQDKIDRYTGSVAPTTAEIPPDLPQDPGTTGPLVLHQKVQTDTSPAAPEALIAPQVSPALPVVNPVRRDDPTYLAIFAGMVEETSALLRTEMDRLTAEPASAIPAVQELAMTLAHAAAQMGLADWTAALHHLASQPITTEAIAATLLTMADLTPALSPVAEAETAAERAQLGDFFNDLAMPLSRMAEIAQGFTDADQPQVADFTAATDAIVAIAEPLGFVRVVEAARQLARARAQEDCRAAKLRLYEELASIEEISAPGVGGVQPRRLLQNWCADTVFDNLDALSAILQELRGGAKSDAIFGRFNHAMRLIYHACKHYAIDSAAQLAMSLVDIFARDQTAQGATDPMLIRIAQSFVETMELVFDALDHGDPPDTAAIDQLMEDAANACFSNAGASAFALEKRLGLPRSFHRVMSPDSVASATAAMEAGLRFYIIRADLNADEKLAESFVAWFATDEARMVTNVTVFDGERTLFDFLIASRLDDAGISERLAGFCPDPARLLIEQSLGSPGPSDPEMAPDSLEAQHLLPTQTLSAGFLATLGELSAGQAAVQHVLESLEADDFMAEVEQAARTDGLALGPLRSLIRDAVERRMVQVHAALETTVKAKTQLAVLQEEATALRARTAETMLRGLAIFADTSAAQTGGIFRMTFSGGDLQFDQSLLDSLRSFLRHLLALRATMLRGGRARINVALEKVDETLIVTLSDDLPRPLSPIGTAEIEAAAARLGGTLAMDARAGLHLTLEMPLPMVTMEGMVVGVGDIRYVVPVDNIRRILQTEADRVLTISADGGRRMLRLSEDEVVPIRHLSGHGGAGNLFIILASAEARGDRFALAVDELVGRQLVQLRPLRGVLARNRALSGVALLGAGEIGMVVSVRRLLASAA